MMKLIIEISEDVYEECQGHIYFPDTGGELFDAVKNATPLDGMTNGEVIRALFPNAEIEYWAEYSTYNIEFPNDNDVKHFSYSWWNAPYQKGGE